jgi:DNA-binding beta-propeller fold protein YncE
MLAGGNMIFGNDKLGFKLDKGWGKLPDGSNILDIPGIAVDPEDRVYVFSRDKQQVFIFDSEGNFIKTIGEDIMFSRPHGIYIGPDGSLYLTDDDNHVIMKFSSSGKLLLILGSKGKFSDSGCINKDYRTIKRGAPPFNYPTNIAFSSIGDIFVSDGYGNARVHRFSPGGELILSWGEPGEKPGQFNLPHDIAISNDGRVYVADRENSRIQVFDQKGNFITQWEDLNKPCGLHIDKDNHIYVAELGKRVGRCDLDYNEGMPDFPSDVLWSRLSIYDLDGKLITRWGEADFSLPGSFFATHCVCTDSKGDLYVGEVLKTLSGEIFGQGKLPPGKSCALWRNR